MKTLTLSDIAALYESVDLECKAAQGRDGAGELPLSFWETYSAMANAEGGGAEMRSAAIGDILFN